MTTTINPADHVADIVLEHPETAQVMQRFGIDFCCGGHAALEEICRNQSLDQPAVVNALESVIAERRPRTDADPRTLSTPLLVRLIIERHHTYLRTVLPFVRGLAEKVHRVHGNHTPWLGELESVVVALQTDLLAHLEFEERSLFPALLVAAGNDSPGPAQGFAAMQDEHLEVGELLRRLRTLTEGFVPPAKACGSWRTLYSELESMEGDVLVHVHLENHVLMPRFAPAAATLPG